MKEAPYQIGQVLALADTIHKDYCIILRKGELPNSLIGTSLMHRALDNPIGALAVLSERILEYLRWAKTVNPPLTQNTDSTEEEERRQKRMRKAYYEAREALELYKPLMAELSECALPTECNDLMKAQLLLGFLATPSAKNKKENEKEGI